MIAYKVITLNRKSFIADIVYKKCKEYVEQDIDTNVNNAHGKGLVVGSLKWAKKRAKEWGGMIIQVDVPSEDNIIVFPKNNDDKYRVKRLKVIS